MDIYEVSLNYRIPIRVVRRMDDAGLLRLTDPRNPAIGPIRACLESGRELSVKLLCEILTDDDLLTDLLTRQRHFGLAESQIAALGDWQAGLAPASIVASLEGARNKDTRAVAELVAWLKSIIPPTGCNHAWLAVRIIMAAPERHRDMALRQIRFAFANCRLSPEFAGWWTKAGDRTNYHFPFDL